MAEKRTIELEVKDNSKSLKAQLREAQAEVAALADKYGATSVQATAAAKKAAELKDRIADSKALTDAFNPDAKFKSFTATLSGVAGGFSAVQGAMGLVGAQGEEVQKTLLKVQSAMAISQGLQSLGEAKDSFINLTGVVGDFVTKLFAKNAAETASVAATTASIAAKETEAVVTAEAAVAQEGLNTAMAMNPIGAVVLAVTALTAGLAYYFSSADKATSATEKMVKQKKEAEKAAKEQSHAVAKESTEFIGLIYQLKATNANSKERADLIKKINSTYNTTLKNISDEAAFQKQLNTEVANYIAYQKAKYELQKNEEKITINLEKQDTIKKKLRDTEKELDKLNEKKKNLPADYLGIGQLNQQIEDQTKKLKTLQEQLDAAGKRLENYGKVALDTNGVIASIEGTNGKFNGSLQKTGDTAQDTAEEIKDYAVDLNKYLDAIEADRQARISDDRQKELQNAANKYDELSALADKAGQDNKKNTQQYQSDIIKINEKYDALNITNMKASDDKAWKAEVDRRQLEIDGMVDGEDKKLAIKKLALDQDYVNLQNALDNKLITEEQYQNLSRAAFQKYNKEDVADKKAAYEQKAALEMQYVDIAGQAADLIRELFGKSKAAQKTAVIIESAAGIAKMVIANKLANLGALATPQAILTSGASAAPVITANNISLGLGIAANVAATAKALKEIGGGGSAPSAPSSTGGGSTGGGSTVMAPNFNVVGNNGLNQLAQLQQQPIKAYVVGAEVTTQQALDRNRITNATL